ncbi:hypothetical protein D1AOALGA4SA_2563 [Olavius algarvensis Delta 1 endosymbiont]|nr:hypothetical protein D1AOALGA4SA_2563 [Olavius algarvensis Delta 1 endosymbiont]
MTNDECRMANDGIASLSRFKIEWTHKRKNSHYISMIR